MTVHAIPFLLERGYSAPFAAFAVGLIGFSQIPGRVVVALIGSRLRRELAATAVFVLIASGIAVLTGVDATAAVLAGLVLLGMGNGMATLARATAIADLYGGASYGTINSVAAAGTTGARAAGAGRRRDLRRRNGIRRAAVDARRHRRHGRALLAYRAERQAAASIPQSVRLIGHDRGAELNGRT